MTEDVPVASKEIKRLEEITTLDCVPTLSKASFNSRFLKSPAVRSVMVCMR